MSEVKTPWKDYMGDVPMHLEYFQGTMFEAVENIAHAYPNNIAFTFMGRSTTYRRMVQEVERCAKSLKVLGIRPGDKVTIAMPNCPQAIFMFYAVNLVGGIANMIHPLSAEKEIEFYLNASESVTAITLDQFYDKFEHIRQNTEDRQHHHRLRQGRALPPHHARAICSPRGARSRRSPRTRPSSAGASSWTWRATASIRTTASSARSERSGRHPLLRRHDRHDEGHRRSRTGNFNALAQQIIATNPMFRPGDKMLAAMPLFHGFGLGVCIHSMLANGGRCILVPRFTAKSYAKQIVKYHCNFIAGVPTLYEALLRLPSMDECRPLEPEGRVLRRRQPVDRAEEEVRQVPL